MFSSPYRLILRPDEGPDRIVSLPLKTVTTRGAQRHASEYAADVGVSGRILIQDCLGGGWVTVRIALVKNSEITKWEPIR